MVRPLLLASFVCSAVVGLVVPVAVAVAVRRRWGVPWRVIGYGALVFLVFQVLTRVPAIQAAQYFLEDALRGTPALRLPWLVVAALTAGLCEEIGRYVGYRWWVPAARSRRDGIAFGIGHGGLEMMLFSLAPAVGYVAYSLYGSEARVPAGYEEALAGARRMYATMPAWMPLLGAFERVAALVIQVSLSLMVLRVFTGGGVKWLALAIAYHTLVDLAAVLALTLGGHGAAEVTMAAFAALSAWFILRSRG